MGKHKVVGSPTSKMVQIFVAKFLGNLNPHLNKLTLLMSARQYYAVSTSTARWRRSFRQRVARRLFDLGLRHELIRIGLRRDLAQPFPAPTAKIPILVRPLVESDLPILLTADAAMSPQEQREIVDRRAFAAKRIAGGFVAIDERDGRPCYVQWLVGASDNDFIRQLRGFPQLAADEALLENAYTPITHRGLGIMPAAMALIAERAETIGARYVITFVAQDNIPSLKGCQRSGFSPYVLQRQVWLGFGLVHHTSYTKVAKDD
jgi:hypothetical protein